MYSSKNIIWIKNVKRDGGNSWAYDDVNHNDPFLLHWSTKKRGSAGRPKIGDIIVLFQTPKFINGKRNYKVHFTHLVSPISEFVLEDANNPDYKWCREVQLVGITNPIEALPNHGDFDFFLPNRGLTNPIANLKNRIGLSESETMEEIWTMFQPYISEDILQQEINITLPKSVFGEFEGDKIIKEHMTIEFTKRSLKIIEKAKTEASNRNGGRIFCECCQFDFVEAYGSHGKGFIEGHHKIHISEGERFTTTDDIALVCSNCHRMLHRKNPNNQYYAVEELRSIIDSQ